MPHKSPYPKRLIEVDLPIKRISAHARREKDMRRCHVPLLHIYPAARPPAACRAVICASLWPDPADPLCPQVFRDAAEREMRVFAEAVTMPGQSAKEIAAICDADAWKRYRQLAKTCLPAGTDNKRITPEALRGLLLDFIADAAAWEASTNKVFLHTTRNLTQAAHEALGGAPGTRPLVADPFAGGGAIPLEALRVGADAFASDLNPVAVLLNKVVLEYVPKYGKRLAAEVRKWTQWVRREAEKELAEFYPKGADGSTPIAYLWARTIICEGPGCGAEVPLVRSLWLSRKRSRKTAFRLIPRPRAKRVDFEILENVKPGDVGHGTVARGSATCPICGYTTSVDSVRQQLTARRGGTHDARLICVVMVKARERGRCYCLPRKVDIDAAKTAAQALHEAEAAWEGDLPIRPSEPIGVNELRRVSIPLYGMTTWGDAFTPRQVLSLHVLAQKIVEVDQHISKDEVGLAEALRACLSLLHDKMADMNAALCVWQNHAEIPAHVFGRWAVGMVFDFAEANPLSGSSGSPQASGKRLCDGLEYLSEALITHQASVCQADARSHPLPDDSCQLFVTDPPYYDAIPYAHLLDYFYVWLRRTAAGILPGELAGETIDKANEIVVDRPHRRSDSKKNVAFYERELTNAFAEVQRIVEPTGMGVVVFASKTTASWEAVLGGIIEAGWIVTGSWPIDTEMQSRVAAQGQARLASSVHIVCRPRENVHSSNRTDQIGEWREILRELPVRIHEWMPRLADEGVVGADAIFACLGPGKTSLTCN